MWTDVATVTFLRFKHTKTFQLLTKFYCFYQIFHTNSSSTYKSRENRRCKPHSYWWTCIGVNNWKFTVGCASRQTKAYAGDAFFLKIGFFMQKDIFSLNAKNLPALNFRHSLRVEKQRKTGCQRKWASFLQIWRKNCSLCGF
jgi:hypothetical protein